MTRQAAQTKERRKIWKEWKGYKGCEEELQQMRSNKAT